MFVIGATLDYKIPWKMLKGIIISLVFRYVFGLIFGISAYFIVGSLYEDIPKLSQLFSFFIFLLINLFYKQ